MSGAHSDEIAPAGGYPTIVQRLICLQGPVALIFGNPVPVIYTAPHRECANQLCIAFHLIEILGQQESRA